MIVVGSKRLEPSVDAPPMVGVEVMSWVSSCSLNVGEMQLTGATDHSCRSASMGSIFAARIAKRCWRERRNGMGLIEPDSSVRGVAGLERKPRLIQIAASALGRGVGY